MDNDKISPKEMLHMLHPEFDDRLITLLLKDSPEFCRLLVSERFTDDLRFKHQIYSKIIRQHKIDRRKNKNSDLWNKYPEFVVETKSIIHENRVFLFKILLKRLVFSIIPLAMLVSLYYLFKSLESIHAIAFIKHSEILSAILIKPEKLNAALVLAVTTALIFYAIGFSICWFIDIWSNNESVGMVAFLASKPIGRLAIVFGLVVFATAAFNIAQFSVLSSVISIYALIVYIFPKNKIRGLFKSYHAFTIQNIKNGVMDDSEDSINDGNSEHKC